MKTHRSTLRFLSLTIVVVSMISISTRLKADTGMCGDATITLPFTDVAAGNVFFCSIAGAFFSGLTNGTSATTYSPNDAVSRQQMAAFTTRTLDQSLRRGHTRAALGEWWTNILAGQRLATSIGSNPRFLACDGLTVWVSNNGSNSVSRVDIRTGALICTLTGIVSPEQIVIVSGTVYIASFQSPGRIYSTDIKATTNGVLTSFSTVGSNPAGMTYDGQNLWTANLGTGPGTGSVSRTVPGCCNATTFAPGFSQPLGILFDGANLWVTDAGDTTLKRVDTNTGSVLQTIPLSGSVGHPVFDGTNLWIPCAGIAQLGVSDKVFVVRGVGGLVGTVLAELTGNGLNGAFQSAFDGERICVTNAAAQSVSLWKAADLSPIASVNLCNCTANPRGICSDGTTFFIGVHNPEFPTDHIFRF